MAETFLWVEEYRPQDIDTCILPKVLKGQFTEFVQNMQNNYEIRLSKFRNSLMNSNQLGT